MGREKQRRCLHCGLGYTPDRRNARHQKYCGAAPCKAASKKASQDKWLAKSENLDYNRGAVAVARVQAWRMAHPGYSRRLPELTPTPDPLQEALPFAVGRRPTLAEVMAPAKISCNAPESVPAAPLQDLLASQPIVLVGLIAHLWGSPLQEDIASALTRLIQLGQDIRGGEHEYSETGFAAGPPAPGAGALQLAGSPPGP